MVSWQNIGVNSGQMEMWLKLTVHLVHYDYREKQFGHDIFVISMCDEQVEAASRNWLDRHEFYDRTGVAPDNVIYCRRHADKAPIAKRLGITRFVDDRLKVLSSFVLEPGHELFLFRPRPDEVKPYAHHLGKVRIVKSWSEITDQLLVNGSEQNEKQADIIREE